MGDEMADILSDALVFHAKTMRELGEKFDALLELLHGDPDDGDSGIQLSITIHINK